MKKPKINKLTNNFLTKHKRGNYDFYIKLFFSGNCMTSITKGLSEISQKTVFENTLFKSALVGVATFTILGASTAATVAIANVIFSQVVTPAENNQWFSSKHFTDITHEENTYLYKFLAVRVIIFVIPCFFGVNLIGQDQFIMRMLTECYKAANYKAIAYLITKICLIAPIAEEIIFRGLLQEKVRDLQALLWGSESIYSKVCIDFRVNFQAVLFGLVHIHPQNKGNAIICSVLALAGQVLGYLKEKTGDLISPIGVHVAHNNSVVAAQLLSYQITPIKA